ncbi:hypothetical protein GA829_14555 [Mesorhizobium sp. INR15]|nr:hypothetical protein GA829_14555 [Mesorhizobium sp. INR15]
MSVAASFGKVQSRFLAGQNRDCLSHVDQTLADQTLAEQTLAGQNLAGQNLANQNLPLPFFHSDFGGMASIVSQCSAILPS